MQYDKKHNCWIQPSEGKLCGWQPQAQLVYKCTHIPTHLTPAGIEIKRFKGSNGEIGT